MPTVIERQTERVRQAKREAIDTINRQRERLAADRSRTEAWRRAEMERIAAEVADRAKAEAQRAWETALAAQEATVEEVRAAQTAGPPELDWAKVNGLAADYSATIRSLPADALDGNGRASRVRGLLDVARRRAPEDVRALRIAAVPELEQLARGMEGTEATIARELLSQFRTMAQADLADAPEDPAEVVERQVAELRQEVLDAERQLTGRVASPFDPLTPWARDVLGATVFSEGLVVDPAGR